MQGNIPKIVVRIFLLMNFLSGRIIELAFVSDMIDVREMLLLLAFSFFTFAFFDSKDGRFNVFLFLEIVVLE